MIHEFSPDGFGEPALPRRLARVFFAVERQQLMAQVLGGELGCLAMSNDL
jgi:hypothetical protein